MAEYKLSYTASEIDTKLGKVDNLETRITNLSSEIADIKSTAGYTNVLETAKRIDDITQILKGTDGSVGYLNNHYIKNNGYSSMFGWDVTGLISAKKGDIIRLRNVTMRPAESGQGAVIMYTADGTWLNSGSLKEGGTIMNSATFDANGNVIELPIPPWDKLSDMAYVVISCQDINEKSIITVNEEIPEDDVQVKLTELDTRVTALENKGGTSSSEDIPDYVITEAESVIDRVIAVQGNRTFTFAAITDMHYGNSSYTDGIKHACQAMKYIDERIKLDAIAILGDYTDGYPSTGIENAMGDFKSINAVLDSLRFATNLRQQGNHDYYPDNIPITRRLIQSYSNDVVWGDRLGGYYYKDFEDYKIRVICPNTNENNPMDTSTNKPSSSVSMTTAQINWLINTLDISAKSDAEEWGILILSHHPLDYWTSDSKYVLGYIIDAYKEGKSWSGDGFSCNFTGKNSAKLIGNIHGHIHNLLTDKMFKGSPNNNTRSEIYRSCVPNACYDRENQYTGTWGESATYSKTQNSADDTAFMVYVVDLDEFKVNGFCYGAGEDRYFAFGEVAPKIFTVTSNFTNITSNNSATTIEEGQPYSAMLTPAGASITSVTVTMGGVDVTSSVYSNGVISIASVTGNIVITAVGEAKIEIINLLDTIGYADNTRLSSSSGTEKTQAGHVTTGYFDFRDVVVGDKFYFKGIDFRQGSYPDQGVYAAFYADKSFKSAGYINTVRIQQFQYEVDASTGDLTLTCDLTSSADAWAPYLRFSGLGTGANAIVTKNQPI